MVRTKIKTTAKRCAYKKHAGLVGGEGITSIKQPRKRKAEHRAELEPRVQRANAALRPNAMGVRDNRRFIEMGQQL